MKKFFDGVYSKACGIYKLLPDIVAGFVAFASFVFGIFFLCRGRY